MTALGKMAVSSPEGRARSLFPILCGGISRRTLKLDGGLQPSEIAGLGSRKKSHPVGDLCHGPRREGSCCGWAPELDA
jgi:hypothetical protein